MTSREQQTVMNEITRLTGKTMELPAVYAMCRGLCPKLSIGQFHDILRVLVAVRDIRLKPWTRAYAEIATQRTAMFHDGEVMYFLG